MRSYSQIIIQNGLKTLCFLLISFWTPTLVAKAIDRSDLNKDDSIDADDLEIFSQTYLEQDRGSVDWCIFYEASVSNEKYFRKLTSDKSKHYDGLLQFIANEYDCVIISHAADKSDLNKDSSVDTQDLILFGSNYLDTYWETVDWCLFHEQTLAEAQFQGRSTKYYLQHFHQLLSFVNDEFQCGGSVPPSNALQLEDQPAYPVRLKKAGNGTDYYVTDPSVGALFIYDQKLVPVAEIKGLNRPLGVAVDANGYILVGNDGRDNIEVYDPTNGEMIAAFGEGLVKMPAAITTDLYGNIYVTDSLGGRIMVFDANYRSLGAIGQSGTGENELDFPVDAKIYASGAGGPELFVADQGNRRVQIYDMDGNWLRSIVYHGKCGWFSCTSPPFSRLQAIEFDAMGKLHVLDNFNASVMTFDPASGSFLGAYGEYGLGTGFLRVPMDILITDSGQALVIAGEDDRIELFNLY